MDPSIATGVISLATSYIQGRAASKQQAAAMKMYIDGTKAIQSLTPPDLQSLIQPYQEAVFLGKMTPEEYVAQVQKDTQLKGITIPPQLIQQQYDVLNKLKDISDSGGLTATDRAQLNDIAAEEAGKARGAREAASQEMAARGISGSGLEIARKEAANQSAVQAASKRGTDVASLAEQRALAALQQGGQLAGQMRTQTVGEQQAVASAQDVINRFNTSMADQANTANVNARNQAAADALQKQYAVQTFNIGQKETEQQARLNALQTQYTNEANKVTAMAGRGTNIENSLMNQAGQSRTSSQQNLALFGSQIPAMINSYNKTPSTAEPARTNGETPGAYYSDPELKKDISKLSPEDIQATLDNLTGYKYKYKQPEMGAGPQMGIMADDVANSPAGDMVVQAPKGLAIDDNKSKGFALAALANLNERMNKLEGT
jgi:hypothetical protein